MKKFIFLILLIGVSCVSDTTSIPSDILGPDKMTRVLVEVHILEAKVNRLGLPPDSTKAVYSHYEKLLLKDLQIDPEQYERSLGFYMENLELFESVYERVIDSLMVRESYTPPPPLKSQSKDSVSMDSVSMEETSAEE